MQLSPFHHCCLSSHVTTSSSSQPIMIKASPVVPHLHFFSFLSKFTSLGCLHFINNLLQKNARCILNKCYLLITPNTSIPRIVPVLWWYLLNVCRIKALFIVSSKWKSGTIEMAQQVKEPATNSEDLISIPGILQVALWPPHTCFSWHIFNCIK